MILSSRLRKFTLTAHVAVSVGWLGTVAAYLALAIAGLTSPEAPVVRAAYVSMDLIGRFVIVPCSLVSLFTGLVQSLGSEWGLIRHYWVLVKFLLTAGAITILLIHMPSVGRMAAAAAETTLTRADFGAQRIQLVVHAAGGLLVLLGITTLSVYKPWGKTPFGRRRDRGPHAGSPPVPPPRPPGAHRGGGIVEIAHRSSDASPDGGIGRRADRAAVAKSRWRLMALIGVIGLVLLFIVLHLAGGGLHGH